MTFRLAAFIGAAIGFVVSATVLLLMFFEVSGVLIVDNIDFMYVLWPSSIVLLGGWRSTPLGVFVTICAVVANCLMYAAAALLLRWAGGVITKIR